MKVGGSRKAMYHVPDQFSFSQLPPFLPLIMSVRTPATGAYPCLSGPYCFLSQPARSLLLPTPTCPLPVAYAQHLPASWSVSYTVTLVCRPIMRSPYRSAGTLLAEPAVLALVLTPALVPRLILRIFHRGYGICTTTDATSSSYGVVL